LYGRLGWCFLEAVRLGNVLGIPGIAGWRLGLFNNELYAVGYLLDAVGVPTYRIARWTKPTFEAGDANVDGTANVGDAYF